MLELAKKIEKQENAVHEAESKNQEESSRLKEDYVKNLEVNFENNQRFCKFPQSQKESNSWKIK